MLDEYIHLTPDLEFDENNQPILQSIDIPPTPIDQPKNFGVTGLRPIPLWRSNTRCDGSAQGWCLFNNIYESNGINIPIIASWWDEEQCEESENDAEGGGDDLMCDETEENPCGAFQECHEGQCLDDCSETGECFEGTCVDGVCIPDDYEDEEEETSDCFPYCPPGYSCVDGTCHEDVTDQGVCNINENVTGGTGHRTFTYAHSLQAGARVTVEYRRYAQPDALTITVNGETENVPCDIDHDRWDSAGPFTVNGPGVITIRVDPCVETSIYSFRILCENMRLLQNGEDANSALYSDNMSNALYGRSLIIVPNPVEANFLVRLNEVPQAFLGSISIIDGRGNEIWQNDLEIANGRNSIEINDISYLPNGVYVVLIRKDGVVYATERFVKME